MTAIAVRNRTLTVGGGLLATVGLAATLAVGPAAFADTAPTTANAEVTSTIALTGDAAFTLTGAPGDSTTSTSALTAESNNSTGYNVSVHMLTDEPPSSVSGTPVCPFISSPELAVSTEEQSSPDGEDLCGRVEDADDDGLAGSRGI